MYRFLATLLVLGGLLVSGCADIAYWQLETFYRLDCRPEHLKNGQCVPVKAQETRPQDATAKAK